MRSVLVTGAGSGIGRATALLLAARGAGVAVLDLDAEAVAAAVAEIGSNGGTGVGCPVDVADDGEVKAAVGRAQDELEGLDAVVCCAGIEATGTIETTSEAEWARCLDVNLRGVVLTARHTVPAMAAAGGGAFVAVASDLGVKGAAGWTPYVVAKHGVVGLVRCLALDYGPRGVRSNVAAVDTPMAARLAGDAPPPGDGLGAAEDLPPLGRVAAAEEVAAVLEHLISPAASYTNGHVYMVDGGASA